MNYDYTNLKSRIKTKYSTFEKFADALEIGRSTLSLKLNNNAEWSQAEMSRAMKLLDIPETDIDKYFLPLGLENLICRQIKLKGFKKGKTKCLKNQQKEY